MTLAELEFIIPNLRPVAAEIFLLVMACAILLVGIKDKRQKLAFILAQIALAGAIIITAALGNHAQGQIQETFGGMYVNHPVGIILKLALCLIVMVALLYSWSYIKDRPEMFRIEYFALTLFATLGMMVMVSAGNLVTVYIGLELMSLPLYALVALNRNSIQATEAAMKYFVLGSLSSGLLLYGISMVYGATGSLDIVSIASIVELSYQDGTTFNETILSFGLVFIIAGFAFKLGVVPFHMWIPDVYHGAPTTVALFIASAPKLATFAIVVRVLIGGLNDFVGQWQVMLLILAVLSMAIGNLAALTQTNIKRMLAYSAIAHMGFMLLGLGVGSVEAGDFTYAINAYSASMFYIITYALASVGAFGMILLLARQGFEADEIKDFAGLNKRSPWFAGIMMMLMFSMAGIPFFVGFFAKFAVLSSVVSAGHIWLAVLAVFFSLIGAYYYLRVIKVMYFDPPATMEKIDAPVGMKLALSINGLAVAILGILPNFLMVLCANAFLLPL